MGKLHRDYSKVCTEYEGSIDARGLESQIEARAQRLLQTSNKVG
jgi:hypothetical protein